MLAIIASLAGTVALRTALTLATFIVLAFEPDVNQSDKEQCRANYDYPGDDVLYHKSRLPIWKTANVTIQARVVV